MTVKTFSQLFAELDAAVNRAPPTVVAAGGADPTVLAALQIAIRRGWVRAIVTGSADQIRACADQHDLDLSGIEIADSADAADAAASCVQQHQADLMMKGQVSTPDLMRSILDRNRGLRTEKTICQVVLMELPHKKRSFVLADTGVCIQPSIEQKIEIMNAATRLAVRIGSQKPRVALVAATEKPTEAMPETLDASLISRQFAAESDQSLESMGSADCFIQGPLSFDLAFDAAAGGSKKVSGPVVGRADVLVFPNLVSANLTVKAIMYTADCLFGGVLCGVRCPVAFMSRSDSTETRLRSLALALQLV